MNRDELIEQASSAYREQRSDGTIADAPAWHDLDASGRIEAHRRAVASRTLESALDPDGLSTTAKLLLAKIR